MKTLLLFIASILASSYAIAEESNKTMYYSLALEPEAHIYQQAHAMRALFDPTRAEKMKPHITLKFPFFLNNAVTEEQFIALITELTEDTAALQLQAEPVSSFQSPVHGHVIHWPIAHSEDIRQLIDKLVDAIEPLNADREKIPAEREKKAFYPHLTLAQNVSSELKNDALNHPLSALKNPSFIANKLLIGKSPDLQQWHVVKIIKLTDKNHQLRID